MRKLLILVPVLLVTSCAISDINPFSRHKEPQYTPYTPAVPEEKNVNLKGAENIVYYIKKYLSPVEGEIVLNSYDGFIIDVGRDRGISPGDRFISDSGAVLKVREVKGNYSIALPTLGNPTVGEKVQKLTFSKVAFINFAGKKGEKLYRKLKIEVKNLNLAPYSEGEKLKKTFHLKYPSDFKRKVPLDRLTGYDAFLVVSREGAALYDTTKHLIRFFPWEGTPQNSIAVSMVSNYKEVFNFKGHATSLFVANILRDPGDEILVCEENRIDILKPTTYGVKLVKKFSNPFKGSYLFHVCPVDLDKNGNVEVVIDGFYQDSKSVSSGIFTIKNGKLVKLASSNLILSCFDTDGDGINDSIFGQTVSEEGDKFFGKKVYVMRLKGNKLVKGKEVAVPKDFQVTSAQLFKSGGKEFFAYYDLNYYFNVSDGKEIVWRSPIQIGASPNAIYWYSEGMLVSYYITPKPKAVDVDGDGNQEVLFSQNKNAVPGVLRNIYTFDGGRILLLYRNGPTFDWEEATVPIYNLGGLEEFDYLPDQDLFTAIFTKVNIITRPSSKLLFIKPKI